MVWGSNNGRSTRLAPDTSDPRGLSVDVDVRIAWLLRVNRMGSVFGGTCSDLSKRLSAGGYSTNTSWLSRRETGSQRVPMGLLSAVEQELRLERGHLVGMALYLRRMLLSTRVGSVRSVAGRRSADLQVELDRLAGAVDDGTATGADWMCLTHLVSTGQVVVPLSVVRCWVSFLAAERTRSFGVGYVTRTAALAELMMFRSIDSGVADAVREVAQQPGALHVADTYAVLGCSRNPQIQLDLVRQLTACDGEHRRGAARALVQALSTSSVQEPVAAVLAGTLLELAGVEDTAVTALSIASRVSSSVHRQVAAVVDVPADPTTNVSIRMQVKPYLRAAAAESGVEDPMLDRLLTEALDSRRAERSRHAAVLIGMTPYAGSLASVAARDPQRDLTKVLVASLVNPALIDRSAGAPV